MPTPGAEISGFKCGFSVPSATSPSEEPLHGSPSWSKAPTDMASFTFDGVATRPSSSAPPSLPAAAITNTPLAKASCTALVVGPSLSASGSLSPPKDNEIISASNVLQHHSIALETVFSSPVLLPSPSSPNAAAIPSVTPGATPCKYPSETNIPAIIVP